MIKKLLLFTSAFILFSNFLSAQTIDEDGNQLSGVTLECNEVDQGTFDSDLEDLLDNYSWTNSDGGCNGNVDYDPASFDYGSFPPALTCGDLLSVDLDIDCDGTLIAITVDIEIDDTTDPIDTDPDFYDFVYECGDSGTDPQTELDDWIANIENNAVSDQVWLDECADQNATVAVINGPYTVDLTACNAPEVQVIVVEFEMADGCGNTSVFEADFIIEDNEDPLDFQSDSSLDDPNIAGIPCDMTLNEQEIQDWIDDLRVNGANSGFNYFSDGCTDPASLIINVTNNNLTQIDPVVLDFTQPMCPMSWLVDVTVEDLCGNFLSETYSFEIEDTADPEFMNGDNFYDVTVDPCEQNVGADHNVDFENWVTNTISDMQSNGDAIDACTPVADLVITANTTSITIDFEDCQNTPIIHEEEVEFTVTDLCGNTGTAVHVWTLIDNVDPALDITGWTQATPFPECNDLSTIQTAVENALLSGVLMEDCADISNLDIDDFNITPDLNGLSLDDLNFVTNSPSGCFEIMIDAEYEDPCGNLSNIATFTFMVDDNTPPDLGNLDCPSVNEYCPGEIETEQDILDLLFGGTRSFLNDIDEACVDDVDNYDVTEFNSFFPEDCGEMGFYEWQIADRCGNLGVNSPCTSGDGSVYRVEWEVNANGALDALQWIGDPEDFFPPEDFTIQYTDPNCTSEFDMMPASGMCLWEGIRDGMTEIEMWNWEAVEDVVWEGGCDVEVTYSHVPCSDALDLIENQMPPGELVPSMTNSALETEVCITIVDQCDATQLQYCFKVTIQCGSCGETGNIYCATCEESQPPLADGGCKLCDPMQLAEGYESCTPPCDDPSCPILGPPQPGVLCDSPGFVPHNMSWFAFVASSEESTVEVFIFNCVGAGVQSGIYTNCEFDEPCVGFNVNCSSGGTIEYDANFNVGQTYYMFVDGCNGSECEYEVTVDGLNELVPDDMDHLTAFSDCKNAELTDDFSTGADNASISGDCDAADMITVCPGEIIQFGVRHQGNIGNFPDNDRPCDEYPLLPAVFQWSTSWGDNYDFNPFEENTGFFVPAIEMPAAEGVYSICLDFIDYECYPVIGPTCLEINVVNLVKETYEHKVCAEDLEAPLNPMGWDPAGSNDDPNGDGIAWLGDFNVTLDEIQQWPENSDGYFCMDYVFKDPDCNCDVPQELCIDPVGQAFADKNPITLYLWECQVTECRPNRPTDCEAVPYEWVWDWNGPEEIVDLYGSNSMNPGQTIDECFRIDGYHTLEDDWRTGGSEFCDTIPIVTVEIAQPAIVIDSLGCGAYCVDMNQTYDDFDDDFEDWPQPFIPSTIVEFLDCDNGNVITTNECLFLDSPTDVCIKVTYEFQDGAWSDDGDNTHPFGPIIETCETIYGPFEWGQEPPNPPTYEGDDTFCATALTDHIFTIDSPNPALTYVWNQNPVVPGVVVTDISTNGDGSVVSIDLPAGFDPAGCTNVIAQGPCGESEPTDVCFMLLDPPTVSLDPIADVCITSAPDGNANITALVSAQASPASPNYVYTWMNGTSTTSTFTANTSFMFPSSGTQSVTVMVTDTVSNCSSVASLPVEFQVNDPLDPPLVSCGNQGQNELEITWEAVPGATGYTVFVDGVAQTPDLGPGDLSYTETGLQLGQTVNFSVMSLGGDPCFNSAVSTETPCTTTDCPPAGVSQDNSLIEPFTFCENDTPGVIDISSAFPFTDANGALAYVSTNNVVDDAGSFNTSGLTSGLYDIEVTYTFDDQCPPRIFNLQYTVTEVPDPSFEIESPICVNNGAAITGTPPGVTWDYDGGTPDANGLITWPEAGTYTVQAVANLAGCLDSTTREIVVEPALEDIVFEPCEAGLDFVNFDWNDVDGATGYDLVITDPVNGTNQVMNHPNSDYPVTGLNENDLVEITVTALSDIAGCESTATFECPATACEQFPPLSFIPCDEVPGMVTFAWNPITNIDSFYVYDSDGMLLSMQTELEWTVNNLGPNESVTIEVHGIHPTSGCPPIIAEFTCTAPCPDEPVMGQILCDDSGIDFVSFSWGAVNGVTEYEVTISVNGRPSTIDTITDTNTSSLAFLSMLNQDDEVEIFVVALNPNTDCDNSDPERGSCVASSCNVPQFTDPELVVCWNAADGPIQLSIGDVVDGNGMPLIGDVTWDDNDVDPVSGEFTPDAVNSAEYTIDFIWADRDEPTVCIFDGEITVQVNILPRVSINPVDAICEGSIAIITATESNDDAVSVTESDWDFGGGTVLSGSGYGPYEVQYDTDGTYTVSLTAASAGAPDECENTVTQEVVVDAVQEIIITCAAATNSSVVFQWAPVTGANGYTVNVDGSASSDIAVNPVYEVTGITTGSASIVVTAIFNPPSACDATGMATCPTQDCPPGLWDPNAVYDYEEGCISSAQGLTLPGAADIHSDTPGTPIVSETWVSSSPSIDEATGAFDPSQVVFGGSGVEVIDIVYTVVYSDGVDDCQYQTAFTITVYDEPTVTVMANPVDCILDETASVTMQATGGTAPYTYEWANNPPSQDNPVYDIPAPGIYDFVVTDANGCTGTASIDVIGAPDPTVMIAGPSTIFIGETETFEYVLDGITVPVNSVVWYIDDVPVDLPPDGEGILEIIANLEEYNRVFDIRVEVYFSDDCFVEGMTRVEIIDIEKWYIPNVISQGAEDEDNRTWDMFTKGGVSVKNVSIYDRWGELVYVKTLDPLVDRTDVDGVDASGQRWNLGWEGIWGTDRTKDVEIGVYVYVIELVVDEGSDEERSELEAGDITVIR